MPTLYFCTGCLEEVSQEEQSLGFSPCCDARMLDEPIRLGHEGIADIYRFHSDMKTSDREREAVLLFVHSLPSDSKKRRKSYSKPTGKDAWPGKIGDSYKASKKSEKKRPPLKNPIKYDVMSSSGYTVEITGKYTHTIHAENKDKAKRKARAFLRGRDTSIVNASSVIEEPGKTVIHYAE